MNKWEKALIYFWIIPILMVAGAFFLWGVVFLASVAPITLIVIAYIIGGLFVAAKSRD